MATQLPRFKSRAVRSARVGQVRIPRPGREDLRALAGTGQAAASIGLGLIAQEKQRARELEVVDANREIAIGMGFVNQQLVEHKAFSQTTDDIEKIREDWVNRDKAIQDQFGKASNNLSKQRLNNTFNTNRAIWQGSSDARINDITESRANATGITEAENIAITDMSIEAAAENETRELIAFKTDQTAELLSQEEFKEAKIAERINGTRLSPERKASEIRRISGIAARTENARVSNALLGLGASQRQTEGDEAGLIDLDAGIAAMEAAAEEINASPSQTQDAIKTLELQWADQKRGRAVEIEKNQNVTRDALNKAEFEGDLTKQQELVENGIDGVGQLSEEEQGVYLRRIRSDLDAIEKGVAIQTDWAGSYRKVRELIDPLQDGDVTYEEVMKVFNEEAPNIASAQRGQLIEKIITAKDAKPGDIGTAPEDKQIRSAIGRFETNGLFLPSESSLETALSPEDFADYQGLTDTGKEIFDKNWSVQQENRALNDYAQWLSEQKTPPTIEQKEKWLEDLARPPKAQAAKDWLKPLSEVDLGTTLEDFSGAFFPPGRALKLSGAPTAGPRIPSPTTQSAYDSLPRGTRYFHPDGTVRTKP